MKKKTKHRRRKSKGVSSGAPRKRHRRKKNYMSDVMSGANIKSAVINTGLGMGGGALSVVGDRISNKLTTNTIGKAAIGGGIGFLISALGAPKIGIGYAGGSAALAFNSGLHDDAEFAENDVLEEPNIYTNENGELVKMLSDGSMEYLSDEEMQALNDGDVVYPQYSTMNRYQN